MTNDYCLFRSCPMTAVATTRRHFLQVGVRPWRCRRLAAQRSALETRATHYLPKARCPMPNAQ
ncbi:MAG: hypothetical protein RMX68_028175 [Aulosira sp. ZfuVER01]|nr:hypothetical protein [Aulosira sp. ZfuVER01]MDZ8000601.1 hypothetical protein [Aulosira sp. DedVER01a]MDZ8051716.1 hypothetical protein [Aulosira sp. ZfuCHP01]